MPSWITDSQFQRVEWLNATLQRVWPQISAACEPLVKASLQPLLDAQCPQVLGRIHLGKFHLGSISPKIVGVRVFDSTESLVRLDVELRWAGDPSVVLTVGSNQVSTPIEVSELRLSAVARVELLDLQPTLPPFKAISITFMKRPTVFFSLKIARLDIMNIGPSDYNVTSIVRNLLQSALSDAILYPKKVVIPMQDDSASDAYYAMHPVGILYITFVKGRNLKQANVFGSDPYVIARSMQQEVRTAVKPYSLNPVWEETHDFMVYDRAAQEIEIEVFFAAFISFCSFHAAVADILLVSLPKSFCSARRGQTICPIFGSLDIPCN
jgi:Ca2+-dependent lipid-binding protein